MKKNLIFLSITGLVLMAVPVVGHEKVVVVPLAGSRALGSDTQFQYNDGGKLGGAEVYYEKATGNVGVGIADPSRKLHVNGSGQFQIYSGGNAAALDFNHPGINAGYFSRLNWRTNDSTGVNEQFAAIDVFYDNYIDSSETASMRFMTRNNGGWSDEMWLKYGRLGIGTSEPAFKLDVQVDTIYTTAARIMNSYDGANTSVLRLQVGEATPTASNTFIEFRAGTGAGTTIAAVEGNGSGGVTYTTNGADFAEYLPLSQTDEKIEAGDIVGLFGGSISRQILDGSQTRVISTAPGVLGNFPGEKREHLFRKVAFLGQVPVKVRGAAQRGDFIVPSGFNDGTGVAVSPAELTPDKYGKIVGVAWQDAKSGNINLVNTEVGLHSTVRLLGELSMEKEQKLDSLLLSVQAMQARLDILEGKIGGDYSAPR